MVAGLDSRCLRKFSLPTLFIYKKRFLIPCLLQDGLFLRLTRIEAIRYKGFAFNAFIYSSLIFWLKGGLQVSDQRSAHLDLRLGRFYIS